MKKRACDEILPLQRHLVVKNGIADVTVFRDYIQLAKELDDTAEGNTCNYQLAQII